LDKPQLQVSLKKRECNLRLKQDAEQVISYKNGWVLLRNSQSIDGILEFKVLGELCKWNMRFIDF